MSSIRVSKKTLERLNKLKVSYGAISLNELMEKVCDAYDYYNEKLVSVGEIMEDEDQ